MVCLFCSVLYHASKGTRAEKKKVEKDSKKVKRGVMERGGADAKLSRGKKQKRKEKDRWSNNGEEWVCGLSRRTRRVVWCGVVPSSLPEWLACPGEGPLHSHSHRNEIFFNFY